MPHLGLIGIKSACMREAYSSIALDRSVRRKRIDISKSALKRLTPEQPGPLHAPRLRVAKLEPRDIAGLYLFAGVATSLSIVRAKERGSTANCRTSSFLEVSL